MTSQLTEKLAPYGIDYDDAMDRFGGNAELFKRLALKYLDDDRFACLTAAMQVDDFGEAHRQAHSLKGTAGNLSFAKLYNASSEVCINLREGEYAAAQSFMPDVALAHKRVIDALELLGQS